MANKDSWNEIAGYSWKELTDEGYTTWKSLYYVALAAVGTITFAFDSFANLRHIWDSINPVTIDWTEATKGSSEWTETNMDETSWTEQEKNTVSWTESTNSIWSES